MEAALRRPSARRRIRHARARPRGARRWRSAPRHALFIVAIAVLSRGSGRAETSRAGPPSVRARRPPPRRTKPAAASPARSSGAGRRRAGPSRPSLRSPGTGARIVAPRAPERKVERSAQLSLAPERREVDDVADGVIRTTDRLGGFVVSSSVSSGGDGTGATFDLRVPSARLQQAVADLSELAHVRSRTQNALDITARFASPRRRLADATAERRGLLRQLATADTAERDGERARPAAGRQPPHRPRPRAACAGCRTGSPMRPCRST